MSWEIELELASSAARKAGAALRDLMKGPIKVLSSVGKDIKLQADCDSEAIILEELSKTEYPALAEESGEHGITDDDTPFWAIDPLDGSLNYSRGIPVCCVSIALCRRDEALVGVIYDFNNDECFTGSEGSEAKLNSDVIRVSDITKREEGILATGFPSYRDFGSDTLKDFISQIQAFKKVRLLGSAALSMTNVACGRVDAYAEDDIMLWDVAAGAAIVRSAGGYVKMEDSGRVKWGKLVRCSSCSGIWEV